jgi:hypothetical protein
MSAPPPEQSALLEPLYSVNFKNNMTLEVDRIGA